MYHIWISYIQVETDLIPYIPFALVSYSRSLLYIGTPILLVTYSLNCLYGLPMLNVRLYVTLITLLPTHTLI